VLVNTSKTRHHTVLVQTGAHAEHQCTEVQCQGGTPIAVNSPRFAVRLAPGSGARLTVRMKRYVNTPSLLPPWRAQD
jgi:hypothetical protein